MEMLLNFSALNLSLQGIVFVGHLKICVGKTVYNIVPTIRDLD